MDNLGIFEPKCEECKKEAIFRLFKKEEREKDDWFCEEHFNKLLIKPVSSMNVKNNI